MDEDKQREIAKKGGESVPDEKRSFSRDHELASEAGRRASRASLTKSAASPAIPNSHLKRDAKVAKPPAGTSPTTGNALQKSDVAAASRRMEKGEAMAGKSILLPGRARLRACSTE